MSRRIRARFPHFVKRPARTYVRAPSNTYCIWRIRGKTWPLGPVGLVGNVSSNPRPFNLRAKIEWLGGERSSKCPRERPACSYCRRMGQVCNYGSLDKGYPTRHASQLDAVGRRLDEVNPARETSQLDSVERTLDLILVSMR